jgi:hypothetical protein
MYKIRNGCTAYLTNDRKTGKPIVVPIKFYPTLWWTGGGYVWAPGSLGMSFYPVGCPNPFGLHGNIPGDEGGNENEPPPPYVDPTTPADMKRGQPKYR